MFSPHLISFWSFEQDLSITEPTSHTIKVAVIGDSQAPLNFTSYRDVEVHIFRKSGAQLHHMSVPPLNQTLTWHHDISILFLRGNNISINTPKEITQNIIETVHMLQQVSRQVFVVGIECREYLACSPYAQCNKEYRAKARAVNVNWQILLLNIIIAPSILPLHHSVWVE